MATRGKRRPAKGGKVVASVRTRLEQAMRDSEARYRALVDWANEGIVEYDRALNVVAANAAATRIIGVPLAELVGKPGFTSLFPCVLEDGSPLQPEHRPTRVTTRTGQPMTGAIIGLVRPGGEITWLSVNTGFLRRSGEAEHYGIVSTLSDITRRKRAEQLLRLEHKVTLLVTQAAGAWEAIKATIRAICESENWDCGRYLRVDDSAGVLRFGEAWSMPGAETEAYIENSRSMVYAPGVGLAGTVWQSGEPLWVADISGDSRVARKALARETGMRGAFVVPVISEGHAIGVFMFQSREIREPDQRLLHAVHVIGGQIGQLVQRARAEQAMRESEARFRRTFELAGSGFAHIALDRRFLRVNRRLCEILGYPEHELIRLTGRDISHPEDLDVINALRPRLYAGEVDTVGSDKRYLRKDGSVIWVTLTLALERDSAGAPQYEIAVYDDITARKAAEDALRDSEARFRSLTQMSSDFFWETDAQHRFAQLVYGPGYRAAQIGHDAIDSIRPTMETMAPFRDFEFARVLPDGVTRYFSVSGEPHFAAGGSFLGYRGVGRDVTEIALAREHIASLAYSDALTGLANRTSLGPSLEQSVQRSRRRKTKLAVLFMDLDGFKQINDRHGHDAGDALLVEVARRLRAHLRGSDLVARLGGDEFLVVLEEVQDLAPVEIVARKLQTEMRRPFSVAGHEVQVSASVGISIFPDDASDAGALMKHADVAMYAAKQAGRNTYRFYSSGPAANEAQRADRSGAA